MAHAFCSPSSAHRWLACTAAPHFEEQFPDSESRYAEEGTLAHSVCELYASKAFLGMATRSFNSRLKKLREEDAKREQPLWSDEMLATAEAYVEHISSIRAQFADPPFMAVEVEVWMGNIVPEGYGRCDCLMVGGDTLAIVDYKHGQGVLVEAEDNPQLKLYALGALNLYGFLYDIKRVSMSICQPRGQGATSKVTEITADELRAWGEKIKPIAQEAFTGPGKFVPGKHCKFCKGKNECKARAAEALSASVYQGRSPTAEVPKSVLPQPMPEADLTVPRMTLEEIGDALRRGELLSDWLSGLRDYALNAILQGQPIPGYKVVEGRATRQFKDPDAAFNILGKTYDQALLYDYKPKTLAQLEKTIGKKNFNELVGSEIEVPKGKPTLVPDSDPRENYGTGDSDFGSLLNKG